jgi:hypothetical protein
MNLKCRLFGHKWDRMRINYRGNRLSNDFKEQNNAERATINYKYTCSRCGYVKESDPVVYVVSGNYRSDTWNFINSIDAAIRNDRLAERRSHESLFWDKYETLSRWNIINYFKLRHFANGVPDPEIRRHLVDAAVERYAPILVLWVNIILVCIVSVLFFL